MTCPHCQSTMVRRRKQWTALGYRRFSCTSCHRRFNERSGTLFNELQFPTDIVLLAVFSMMVAALIDSGSAGAWADGLLTSDQLASPHLMPAEAANILRKAALAGDISADAASLAHADLQQLPVVLFPLRAFRGAHLAAARSRYRVRRLVCSSRRVSRRWLGHARRSADASIRAPLRICDAIDIAPRPVDAPATPGSSVPPPHLDHPSRSGQIAVVAHIEANSLTLSLSQDEGVREHIGGERCLARAHLDEHGADALREMGR